MLTAREQLQEQVQRVAEARRQLLDRQRVIAEAREAFDRAHAVAIAAVKESATLVDASEDALRGLTLAYYSATGEKKPVAGVEVKEKTSILYDRAEAFSWAQVSGLAVTPAALDVKAFEKIAKATPLPFVQTVTEPQAQIASDLDKVLAPTQAAA